jgi:hypothetical protein
VPVEREALVEGRDEKIARVRKTGKDPSITHASWR